MTENRVRRVAEQIKKDIGGIIKFELKDPRVAGITSVTDVDLSKDLRYASVYVSIYGNNTVKEETLQALVKATGFIRSKIGRRIRLRYTPEINFFLDNSIEYGAHIENVIKSLQKNEENKEENDDDHGAGEGRDN